MAKKTVVLSAAALVAAAIVVEGHVLPFMVNARRAKWRGGRYWTAGNHVFQTEEAIAALGTPDQVAAMIETVADDTLHFELEYQGKPRPEAEASKEGEA